MDELQEHVEAIGAARRRPDHELDCRRTSLAMIRCVALGDGDGFTALLDGAEDPAVIILELAGHAAQGLVMLAGGAGQDVREILDRIALAYAQDAG